MSPAAFVADPLAWLGRAMGDLPGALEPLRSLSLWALIPLLGTGLALLSVGARWRRPLAVAGGAGLGALAGLAVAGLLGIPGKLPAALGAVALAGLSLAFPAAFPFAAGALPGAFLGARVELGGARMVGAAIGLFLLGGLALMGARLVAALAAGLVGAAVVAAALAGLSGHARQLELLSRHPVLLLAVVIVLAIAGAAFQMEWAWEDGGGGRRRAGPDETGPADAQEP